MAVLRVLVYLVFGAFFGFVAGNVGAVIFAVDDGGFGYVGDAIRCSLVGAAVGCAAGAVLAARHGLERPSLWLGLVCLPLGDVLARVAGAGSVGAAGGAIVAALVVGLTAEGLAAAVRGLGGGDPGPAD